MDGHSPAPPARAGQHLGPRGMFTLIMAISLVIAAAMTYLLYVSMQSVFRAGIDERLKGMAAIATTNFSPLDLEKIRGAESVGTTSYEAAVIALQRIRDTAPNVRYAYILRRTSDPNTMEFVADADSLHPDDKVDLNHDGRIDEEDALVHPGDPFDVASFPEFRATAFTAPFVDPEFESSQWGTFLSGTAPVFDRGSVNSKADYVLGLDLEVTEYVILSQRVYWPFLGFTAFLLIVIGSQALVLRRLWNQQVEQLKEIDRQKDELLSIVSHQLGGPITSIRWTMESFLDGDVGRLSPSQLEEIQKCMRAAVSLGELVALLLDLSRIELGRLAVQRSQVDLQKLLEDLLQIIEIQAKEKDIHLEIGIPRKPFEGHIDPRLTRMALENLLSNAVKYTPRNGHVRFEVIVREGRMECTIADTGCGIPAADQKLLFTKLFRASNVRDKIPGNGFGLYIARGAIVEQGGTIACRSILDRGTTFNVVLPLSETRLLNG